MSSLVFLNVSMNQLRGRVPDVGFFSNLLPNSFLGNPGLCGRMVGRLCPGEVVTARGWLPLSALQLKAVCSCCSPRS